MVLSTEKLTMGWIATKKKYPTMHSWENKHVKNFKYNKKHEVYFLFSVSENTFHIFFDNTKEKSHERDVTKRKVF